MRLSAQAHSDAAGPARQRSRCCPYAALAHWLRDEDLSALIRQSGAARQYRCWPMETVLWASVLQALSPRRNQAACVQLVSHVLKLDIAPYSGSFCKARQRLAPRVPQLAAQWVARQAVRQGRPLEASHGRRVVQWDGTGCSLSDRPANQASYPQPSGQRSGCGFPQMRFVVMREASSGSFLSLEFGNLNDHDAKLGRALWDQLQPQDILVVDRGFASYGLLWAMARRNCGVVMRQHQRRKLPHELVGDLDDQTVVWPLPAAKQRGDFWDDDLPRQLMVRVVRRRLPDGTVLTLNTNLGPEFSAADICDLYASRWDEEVSFRDLKETLALDPLEACTPQLAETLVWTHVLAYNLVRATMAAAAAATGKPLERLSVQHTLQVLELSLWAVEQPAEEAWISVLQQVGAYHNPDRRGRSGAPRRVKRRHGKYPLLNRPRSEYPARKLAG